MSWKRPNVIDRMAPLLGNMKNKPGYWLDVGTGGGVFTELIRDRFSKAIPIQFDKRRYTKKGQLHFMADLRWLPIRKGSIDCMICAQVLHYIPPEHQQSVLENLARKLSEQGFIVIIEYVNGRKYSWVPHHISENLLEKYAEKSPMIKLQYIIHDDDRRRPKYAGYLKKTGEK